MPHKHTRRDDNEEHYNLPPTKIAKPLPVGKNAQTVFSDAGKKRSKTAKTVKDSSGYGADDTPKAFARLMQLQQNGSRRNALDNGEPRQQNKKRKRGNNADDDKSSQQKPKAAAKAKAASQAQKIEAPKILPGEKLRDFNARVDQALPVIGLARKGKKNIEGMKERQTKTEKRLHKMYDEWRQEEIRIREKAEEEEEKREEEEEERKLEYGEDVSLNDIGKRGKRKRMIGEERDDEDPWAVLKLRREAPKGLHDVAQAPPEFKVIPKEKFKIKNGARADVADVPNAAGSLKRREELGAERKNIIEQYRALMSRSSG